MSVEVDPRVTFANERTFLAWIRTSLALIVGGVAVGAALDTDARLLHILGAVVPIVLGGAFAVVGYRRWEANDAALRDGSPLPVDRTLRVVAVVVGGLALLAAVGTLVWILG